MGEISNELWEEFGNTTFEEKEKILSKAKDLLLYLSEEYNDHETTFLLAHKQMEEALYVLLEKKTELIELFIKEVPEARKLWEEFLKSEEVEINGEFDIVLSTE